MIAPIEIAGAGEAHEVEVGAPRAVPAHAAGAAAARDRPAPRHADAARGRPGALGRSSSTTCSRGNRMLVMVARATPRSRRPGPDELYDVGVVGAIARMMKVPDGTLRILVQGGQRVRIDTWVRETPYLVGRDLRAARRRATSRPSSTALMRNVQQTFTEIVEQVPYLPEELQLAVANVDDPGALSHLIAGSLRLKTEEKQALLEEVDVAQRLRRLVEILARELEVISIGTKIQSQVQSELDKGQREYFLRQQLKAIQEELGEVDETAAEANELREQLDAIDLPEDVRTQVDRELERLETLPPPAAEHGVIRTYLEWIASLPWDKTTEDNLDLAHAREVLDEDHYDIEKVKDRILEFLAVRKLKPDARGSILCFVGPPGVGKTSLGRSIARALGRKFERISVGGVRDEAEIRGHRRTYIGAMPGTIIRALRDAGVQQPAVHDRRDRQDGRGLPRRPGQRDARGARPRAERDVPRPLPRRAVRPLERHVHHHGEHARHDPRPAARPHGDHPARRLHRGGEARDRQALPRAAPDRAQRPDEVADRVHRRRRCGRSSRDYTREAGVRNLEREIGTDLPQGRARRSPSGDGKRKATTISEPQVARAARHASASTPRRERRTAPARAWRPAWRGRRSAATCSSSRRRRMPGERQARRSPASSAT